MPGLALAARASSGLPRTDRRRHPPISAFAQTHAEPFALFTLPDNGAPGIREIYHPEYYAAFITDPEGHNIEAVCFEPEDEQ